MNDTDAALRPVAYLDFEGVLFDRDDLGGGRDVLPLLSRLGKDNRLGLLVTCQGTIPPPFACFARPRT
jgi:hypothetical protein